MRWALIPVVAVLGLAFAAVAFWPSAKVALEHQSPAVEAAREVRPASQGLAASPVNSRAAEAQRFPSLPDAGEDLWELVRTADLVESDLSAGEWRIVCDKIARSKLKGILTEGAERQFKLRAVLPQAADLLPAGKQFSSEGVLDGYDVLKATLEFNLRVEAEKCRQEFTALSSASGFRSDVKVEAIDGRQPPLPPTKPEMGQKQGSLRLFAGSSSIDRYSYRLKLSSAKYPKLEKAMLALDESAQAAKQELQAYLDASQ